MTWHEPSIWALLLLALTPLVVWRWIRRGHRPAVRFSSLGVAADIRPSWAVRLSWLPAALRVLVFIGLVICLARPQKLDEQTKRFSEGIAIELVVDRSLSMLADDFVVRDPNTGQPRRATRFDAVQAVVTRFIIGGDDLDGRPNDLVGLIAFASFADSLCPLTLDHGHLVDVLMATTVETFRGETGTAIGDALALAVERLRGVEQRVDLLGGQSIKSRIIVLLTDGENNQGDIDPLEAAELAHALGIKVYTIGAGTERGGFIAPGSLAPQRSSIDEETLRAIAEKTGGRYFLAQDTDSLREVYRQIDSLEKTEIEQQRLVDATDLATTSVRLFGVNWPPLVPVVMVLLLVQILLETTRFGRLPV
jgi:Ca-activated chloride channel family protein